MIGFVIGVVLVIALCVGGYDEHKYETIVKYRDKKYKSIDKDLYKNVKIGEKMKGHVVEGTNKLHDVDGYAVEKD